MEKTPTPKPTPKTKCIFTLQKVRNGDEEVKS